MTPMCNWPSFRPGTLEFRGGGRMSASVAVRTATEVACACLHIASATVWLEAFNPVDIAFASARVARTLTNAPPWLFAVLRELLAMHAYGGLVAFVEDTSTHGACSTPPCWLSMPLMAIEPRSRPALRGRPSNKIPR
eukprot:6182815-Pleurochrysis_carterae.AAC.4